MKYLTVFLILFTSSILQSQNISERSLYGTWNYKTYVAADEDSSGGIVEGEIIFNKNKTYSYTGVAYHPLLTFIKVEMELSGDWELVTDKQLILRFGKISFPQIPVEYHKYIDAFTENFKGIPDVTKVLGYKNGNLILRDSMGEEFVLSKGPSTGGKLLDQLWSMVWGETKSDR